ncbi:MAG: hypothetical protein ABUT20_23450, partial [Bacteroidota bacterium]
MSNFTYHGGGIISNPAVTVIYARSISINPDGTPGLPTWIDSTNTFNVPISEVCLYNNFIYDLIDSPFMDLLSKNFSISGGPAIGRGSFTGSYIIDLPFNQKDGNVLQITHADIEKMIDNAVQNGTIPAPAKNTVYVVYVNNIQVTVPNSSDVVGV